MQNLYKEAYMKGGDGCPFCGVKGHMENERTRTAGSVASEETECLACRARWYNVYTLTSIEVMEDGLTEDKPFPITFLSPLE
jgi:hypothetical protein